jgi:hypothetical protein
VVNGFKNFKSLGVVLKTLDANGSLTGGGQHLINGAYFYPSGMSCWPKRLIAARARIRASRESLSMSFAQAGGHVAPDFRCLEVVTQEEELIFTAQT